MEWFVLALCSAIFHTLFTLLIKIAANNEKPENIALASRIFAAIFLTLIFIYFPLEINFNFNFIVFTSITAILGTIAMILYAHALKKADMSLVVPLLGMTPVILCIIAILFLGESVTLSNFLGIILVSIGIYFLNLKNLKDVLNPLKALVKNQGSKLALLVALIYAFSTSFDKLAIQSSNALFFVLVYNWISSFTTYFYTSIKRTNPLDFFKKKPIISLSLGVVSALILIFQMSAVSLGNVSFVIPVKRMSAVFSVVAGYIYFKETKFKQRLFGSCLIVAGVSLLVF